MIWLLLYVLLSLPGLWVTAALLRPERSARFAELDPEVARVAAGGSSSGYSGLV